MKLRLKKYKEIWPIDEKIFKKPRGWRGWPDGKKFALILTHDVETGKGQDRCNDLIKLEESLNLRSSFNFVPERYRVDSNLRTILGSKGFEVGVHGLNHDGKLFKSKSIFSRRAEKINTYLEEWNSVGFRAPAMHHNLKWVHELDILYDASTFDCDPFEAQPDGVETIFPLWVAGADGGGYVELPYTLPQDFTLFVLMQEKSIDTWIKKLDWIAEKGGMALVITHPDYMCFGGKRPGYEEYPASLYKAFLSYVSVKYEGQFWHRVPRDVASWFSNTIRAQKLSDESTDISIGQKL